MIRSKGANFNSFAGKVAKIYRRSLGGKFVAPTILTYKRWEPIFVGFQQITFKLSNFANLKALFSAELTDFSWRVHCQKLKKKNVERTINNRSCQENLFFFLWFINFCWGGRGGVVDQEIKKIREKNYENNNAVFRTENKLNYVVLYATWINGGLKDKKLNFRPWWGIWCQIFIEVQLKSILTMTVSLSPRFLFLKPNLSSFSQTSEPYS